MRRLVAWFALLVAVSAVSAVAGEPFVTVVGPKINLVAPATIQKACATSKPVFGCTNMDATLFTSCQAKSSLFRISATARLTPVVYTVSHTILAHEMAHVADVSSQLKWYAQDLGKATYETEEACEAFAAIARTTFGARVREFQNVSARKQDGHDATRVAAARRAQSTRADLGD